MKNIYICVTLIISSFFSLECFGQAPYDSIDVNNINARINPSNQLFWDGILDIARYEVPKGSGKTSIFASEMWIGGKDSGGNLKLAACTYRQEGVDFWPGPLDTTTASISPLTISQWNKVWKINKSSIDSLKNWDNDHAIYPGYVVPQNIITWPGNGSPLSAQAHQLAPFYDKNNDGIYDPNNGDYPLIKGDQAIFYIFNDAGGPHTESGGAQLGIEVHAMIYGFDNPADTAIYNTIFVNYQIFNRSDTTYYDTYIGNFTDIDLGYGFDDFIGCDVSRSAFYGYNGEANDPGVFGYGTHPPAQGVFFLKGPLADANDSLDNNHNGVIDEPGETFVMSNFVYYNNDFTNIGNPLTANEYENYLRGNWKDSTRVTYAGNGYGGTTPCSYMFPGNSDSTNWGTGLGKNFGPPEPPWSEVTSEDLPGDRRGLGSWGPFTLGHAQSTCFDYAYVTGLDQNRNNIENISTLQQRIDSVKSFFINHIELQNCQGRESPVGINNLPPLETGFTISPNPANDKLMINPARGSALHGKCTITVLNVLGEAVLSNSLSGVYPDNFGREGRGEALYIGNLPSGIYFLQLKSESGIAVKRFVKE